MIDWVLKVVWLLQRIGELFAQAEDLYQDMVSDGCQGSAETFFRLLLLPVFIYGTVRHGSLRSSDGKRYSL